MLYLSLAAKSASAQSLAIHVMWTSDQTTNPWTQAASAGGTVGGQCVIHLSLQCPTNGFEGATVQSLKIHEAAAHYPDLDLSANMHAGVASPLCDPNTAGVMWVYEDVPWASPGMHNGSHTITASMQYSWMSYANGYPQGNTSTVSATITVDVENLLITSTSPANPQPIKWDPATMTNVPLTATIGACYKASQPVKLEIFETDQTLVKTFSTTAVIGPGSTSIPPINWDGTSDNSYLYPDYGAGPAAPMAKDIYIFRWTVGTQGSSGDCDEDKSTSLSFGSPADSLAVITTDASGETFQLGQTLTDASSLQPSACEVDAYQIWDLQHNLTVAMPAVLGTSSTTFKVKAATSPTAGDLAMKNGFCFLISDTDGDMTKDRGHRDRVLLQVNQRPRAHTLLTWGGTYGLSTSPYGGEFMSMHPTTPVANAADALASNLNYGLLSLRGETTPEEGNSVTTSGLPRPDQIIHTGIWLPIHSAAGRATIKCPNGVIAQAADVAILCGHGAPDNFLFGLGSDSLALINPYASGNNPLNMYDVADSTGDLAVVEGANSGACFFGLDAANGNSWATASLVIWLACDTGEKGQYATGPSLPEQTVSYMGADCSMGVLGKWSLADAANFATALAGQKMQGQDSKATVLQGVINAVKAAKCGVFRHRKWSEFATIFYGSGLENHPLPIN